MTRVALLLLVGCGSAPAGDDDGLPPLADSAPVADCVPLGECVWLEEYQRTIVGALAGEIEIAPGIALAHRESVNERAIARQYLIDQFTALGIPVTTHDYATGANVIATLPGGPGGTLVVGAHFDGVAAGPGAADNATGVAIVLAAARYLRDVPGRAHPIVFALFDEEEKGLIGSRAYAASLVPSDIDAAHIFDMLSFDGDGDRAVELWSPSPTLLPIYEEHGGLAAMPIQPVTFDRSDHQAFLEQGIPAVGIGEEFESGDHTPHYHKVTDTFDRVSFAHCGAVTHLALSVLDASVRAR